MDVVALGELLIDFTENGTSAQDNKLFEANPAGMIHDCQHSGLKTKEWLANHGISKDTYYYWYKKVQTICVEAMEIPDTLSMPEFVSLPVPAEPANVPVESAIRSNAVVTMHIGKAKIDIPETTSTEFIKKLIGALAYVE